MVKGNIYFVPKRLTKAQGAYLGNDFWPMDGISLNPLRLSLKDIEFHDMEIATEIVENLVEAGFDLAIWFDMRNATLEPDGYDESDWNDPAKLPTAKDILAGAPYVDGAGVEMYLIHSGVKIPGASLTYTLPRSFVDECVSDTLTQLRKQHKAQLARKVTSANKAEDIVRQINALKK